MPTYLCHGFRWQRRSIRVYVILQDLDDASPEWIIPAKSARCILQSFYDVFEFLPYCSPKRGRYAPARDVDGGDDTHRALGYADSAPRDRSRSRGRGRGRSQSQSTAQSRSLSRAKQQQPPPSLPASDDASSVVSEDDFSAQAWSAIKLLEEYDPRDLTAVSRPYAYVADYAVRIDLSCSIVDEIARYEQQQLQSARPAISIPSRNVPAEQPGWFEELRDQLQRGEEIRWYVVVNGDEVRDWSHEPPDSESVSEPDSAAGYPQQPYLRRQQQDQQNYQHRYQSQYQSQAHPGRPMPTREQRQHHAQYIHQQLIFEDGDREQARRPERQLALEGNDRDRQREQQQPQGPLFEKVDECRKRVQDQEQLVFEADEAGNANTFAHAGPLRSKKSVDAGAGGRPKTSGSKTGGLRRLFGRAKADVVYAP
ncbi:f138cfa4-e802-4545-9b16-abb950240c4b [Thermothielavioides terrestris]|uniref:F138cfa4-e802-4545-9b16-abb950240c4b n=1 Tax=Thermothielavioides terrestris TaxID=2587410 RepID=A0A446BMD2_9PEZI|nr:f138cfa4-e802-4545-9b16-abb950240c4b [Thermothielavioides terrestris]